MMGIKPYQEKMFYDFSLEKRVPQDHLLRKVDKIIDLRFVRDLVAPYYSHTGQPSIDPEVLFRMMIIGYLYGVTSERRLAEDLSVNLAYMWYIRYDLDEEVPDHSVISKARARYGKKVFEEFFQRILQLCMDAGLVTGEKIHIDSTFIDANASKKSLVPRPEAIEVKYDPKEYVEQIYKQNATDEGDFDEEQEKAEEMRELMENNPGINIWKSKKMSETESYRKKWNSNKDLVSKTDPDAALSTKAHTKSKLTYKDHFSVDGNSRVITAVVTTNGAIGDEQVLKKLVQKQPIKPKEVCADSKYGTGKNYEYLVKNGILASIPHWHASPKKRNSETWDTSVFQYDKEKDVFVCPNKKELKKAAYDLNSRHWCYRSAVSECSKCQFHIECLGKRSKQRLLTRHIYEDSINKTLEHLESERAKQSIRERKYYAELSIAEAKTYHGLRRTRFRGRWRVGIQVLLTATVQNIKRLIKNNENKVKNTPPLPCPPVGNSIFQLILSPL